VAAVLGGVALMLWAVIPADQIQAPWALIATPLVPLLVAVACLLLDQSQARTRAFEHVRQQVKADVAMLREVSAA
jgi:uncharacterized membrane protein YqjE